MKHGRQPRRPNKRRARKLWSGIVRWRTFTVPYPFTSAEPKIAGLAGHILEVMNDDRPRRADEVLAATLTYAGLVDMMTRYDRRAVTENQIRDVRETLSAYEERHPPMILAAPPTIHDTVIDVLATPRPDTPMILLDYAYDRERYDAIINSHHDRLFAFGLPSTPIEHGRMRLWRRR